MFDFIMNDKAFSYSAHMESMRHWRREQETDEKQQ